MAMARSRARAREMGNPIAHPGAGGRRQGKGKGRGKDKDRYGQTLLSVPRPSALRPPDRALGSHPQSPLLVIHLPPPAHRSSSPVHRHPRLSSPSPHQRPRRRPRTSLIPHPSPLMLPPSSLLHSPIGHCLPGATAFIVQTMSGRSEGRGNGKGHGIGMSGSGANANDRDAGESRSRRYSPRHQRTSPTATGQSSNLRPSRSISLPPSTNPETPFPKHPAPTSNPLPEPRTATLPVAQFPPPPIPSSCLAPHASRLPPHVRDDLRGTLIFPSKTSMP
jgi:hypothetical protein